MHSNIALEKKGKKINARFALKLNIKNQDKFLSGFYLVCRKREDDNNDKKEINDLVSYLDDKMRRELKSISRNYFAQTGSRRSGQRCNYVVP